MSENEARKLEMKAHPFKYVFKAGVIIQCILGIQRILCILKKFSFLAPHNDTADQNCLFTKWISFS